MNRSHCPFRSRREQIEAVAILALAGVSLSARADSLINFVPGDLVLSASVYTGTASTVTLGATLPGGGAAVADGSYPNVWSNEGPDASFGVSSPIYLDQLTTSGSLVNSVNLTSALAGNSINLSTSFSSKSELALNLSTDGTALTFMAYSSTPNQLDVSNSNTPGVTDPTNPVTTAATYRAVAQLNANGTALVTPTDAYSGNNGRAAILANGNYYLVGNAGNSGSGPTGATLSALSDNTGVQMVAPNAGPSTTVVGAVKGTFGSTTGYQRGFSIADLSLAADKTGKDDNFRGVTVFNNTLYVTKGSGGNGVNTVYQVGTAGSLPTAANAGTTPITILSGFPTSLAKNTSAPYPSHPFGLWFANSTTLYVADEGDGKAADIGTAKDPTAGLEKWTFDGTKWNLAYTLTSGLSMGTKYSVANGPNGEIYPTGLNPATDGLRNLTGRVNGDGTVTLYAVTSTVSASTDQGADPNKLVAITDNLSFSASAQAVGESFSTLRTAGYGEVFRGVSFAPVPEPAEGAAAVAGLCVLGFVVRRASRKA